MATRQAQKRRTRDAILAATQRLLADGSMPSIEDIAAAADVSRRTIYMYFPTLDQLFVDATSGLLTERTIGPRLAAGEFSADPLERIDEYAQALLQLAPEAMPNARRMLRLTVDAQQPADAAPRGYRRMEWLAKVLEPLRERLTEEQYDRLSSALTVVLGWEAIIVLQDTRGLDQPEIDHVLRWAAHALTAAMLEEHGATRTSR